MQTKSLTANDEISLIELVRLFYQKKVLIILTTLIGLVLGSLYILVSKPVYEVKTKITPAQQGDIAALNHARSWNTKKSIDAEQVFLVLNSVLVSEHITNQFFNQFYLPSLSSKQKDNFSPAQIYASFSKNFALIINPLLPSEHFSKFTVTIRGDNPQQVSLWLKQFINLVKEQTFSVILNDIKQQDLTKTIRLQHQIDSVREIAKLKRQDQIVKLQEQMNIAQLASKEDPSLFNRTLTKAYPASPGLLDAKIKILSTRQSDDAFIPNLRQLQTKLDSYKSYQVNLNNVSLFHLDGKIDVPNTPIAPRKMLIIMVSLVLGFMAGLFGVILQIIRDNEKRRKALES